MTLLPYYATPGAEQYQWHARTLESESSVAADFGRVMEIPFKMGIMTPHITSAE